MIHVCLGIFFVCKTIIEYVGIFIPFENSCILSSIYDILGQIARHVVVVPWRHSLHKPFSERYFALIGSEAIVSSHLQ